MKPSLHILILVIFVLLAAASCSNPRNEQVLDRVESMMEDHPDSAFAILKGIDKSALGSKSERARYALLMSMALDKNYIDTTNFDVLQPAIDYYLKKGSPDEKLRTYYYQGRIYQNQGDRDKALNSFIKALDNASLSKDSLSIARSLIAQAWMFYEFRDIEGYKQNHIAAGKIYKSLSMKDHEFDCLINALNGAILLNQSSLADSLINVGNNFDSLSDIQNKQLQGRILTHVIQDGDKYQIENILDDAEDILNSDVNGLLNLAFAYNKTGNNIKALHILNKIQISGISYDTLKFQSIYVLTLKNLGDYKNALKVYWEFSHRSDSINLAKFDQKAKNIREKHSIELQAQNDANKKSQIIWICISGIVLLMMGIVILILLVMSHKSKKDLALQRIKSSEHENKRLKSEKDLIHQRNKSTQLENEKLKLDREKLALEIKNLQLERDKKILEAENLAHRVDILENESESLKKLLDKQEDIPSEVRNAIQIRIEMLNSLLASYITDNDQYELVYDTWVRELTLDTQKFMNSNRLAFQASHPQFIRYFEEHNLTIDEINYVCLYAIGLRGKEVGNYMKKRSHVNMSSAIRKKLGIDKHETNIGIYVRRLLKSL